MCFPQQKFIRNITVDSEPSVSRRFKKRQGGYNPKGRDKVTLHRNNFILYFLSDKLSHYKTYDSEKSLSLMLSNMSDYKTRSSGLKFIKFYL